MSITATCWENNAMAYLYKAGDRVKVGDGIGKLKTGQEAIIVQGPIKVGGLSGVYVVRDDHGDEERVHCTRLSPGSSRNSHTK